VLIVDDEEDGRDKVRRALEGMVVSVLEARTAGEAVAIARSQRPDVVVLDLGLPDAGGDEVLATLRADPAMRDVPVLIFTSKQLRLADRERLRQADEIVSKAEPEAHLRTMIEALWKGTEVDR
jgi:CheY-like chemotaxis protein